MAAAIFALPAGVIPPFFFAVATGLTLLAGLADAPLAVAHLTF